MPDNIFTVCPAVCEEDYLLPAHDVDQECVDYDQPLSQVSDVYIRPNGATDPLAAFATTPTYVANSIDNSDATGAKTHYFVGEGGVDVPEKLVVQYPKRKERTLERTYTLVHVIKNMSDAQYAALCKMQCGSTNFTFYYADVAGFIFGKQGGIVPSFVDVDFPKGAGRDDRSSATLTIKFKANGDAFRRLNPIAL
jgi:hypothetical protein